MRFLHNNPTLLERRRSLRNKATITEKLLWKELQMSKLGFKFRRQYSFGNYILDFYCPEKKLGIEIDGGIHKKNKEMDNYRTRTLRFYGIKVIRFWNEEVEKEMRSVINKITTSLNPPS